ncbi:DUF551 domain-containing protein [Methylomonas rapida]|uniref:DUF551 domain-containing protein n=1 Tax=Methylomonas rapida TaxID=2963939 RepID=A0ABY7GLW0_9GAMM|nr:DUF551 domain-containing protein [Methylomonas rapida]WAR45485.1 DUF551 domain-containing protein [Methylomonas rapida]
MIVMEGIEWLDVNESLPDDEMTVLLYHPTLNEPVWLGYFFQHFFYDVQGNQHPNGAVTHWADMPAGPKQEIDL